MAEELRRVDELFAKYSESHQNKINKSIHWIAVPLIVFSLLGLVWSIPTPEFMKPYLNWASFGIAISLYYYYGLSRVLAITMLIVTFIMSAIIIQIEQNANAGGAPLWQVCAWIFVIAWIFQFIGHKIEGKKPSFIDDVQYLLIGPIWLVHFVYKKLGIKY